MAQSKKKPEWRSWRDLPDVGARIAALPESCQRTVREGQKAGWVYPFAKLRSDDGRRAIYDTLRSGTPIPANIRKNMFATMRGCFDGREDSVSWEDLVPYQIVLLYSYYGVNAPLETWKAQRKHYQQDQAPWDEERYRALAEAMRKDFDGFPALHKLLDKKKGPYKGASNQFKTEKHIEEFCRRYGLQRVLAQKQRGYWETEEGKAELRAAYRSLVMIKERYVSDYELSTHISKQQCGGSSPLTLRQCIKQVFGTVEALFDELVSDGCVDAAWKPANRAPKTNDGQTFHSFQEVWFYELFNDLLARNGLSRDDYSILWQARIPGSGVDADFLIANKIFVEVLRYNLDALAEPKKEDAREYRRLHDKHMDAFEQEGITPVVVEPRHLKRDDPEMFDKMREVILRINKSEIIVGSEVLFNTMKGCSHWFSEEERDKGYLEMIERRAEGEAPFRFPTEREVTQAFGGLRAFLRDKAAKGRFDIQAEALRVHCVASDSHARKSRSPARPLTKDEVAALQRHHGFDLTNHEQLRALFGEHSPYYLLHCLDPGKTRDEYVLPGLRRVLIKRYAPGEAGIQRRSSALIDPAGVCALGADCRCLPQTRVLTDLRNLVRASASGEQRFCRNYTVPQFYELLLEPCAQPDTGMEPTRLTFGQRLAFVQQLRQKTTVGIAGEVRTTPKTYKHLVMGDTAPTQEKIAALARALSVSEEVLNDSDAFIEFLKTLSEEEVVFTSGMDREVLLRTVLTRCQPELSKGPTARRRERTPVD